MNKLIFLLILVLVHSISMPKIHSEMKETSKLVQLAANQKAHIYVAQIRNSPIRYPQVSGLSNQYAQKNINNKLKHEAILANNNRLKLIEDEKQEKKSWDSSKGPWRPYEYKFTYKVPFNENNKLSIIYYEYYYTGGAHGGTNGKTFNFDLKTGDYIPLSSIIRGKQKEIQKYTYDMLQKKYEGYVLIHSPFGILLNDQDRLWVFNKKGITLIFKEYEVAAYAAGMPEIIVPSNILGAE